MSIFFGHTVSKSLEGIYMKVVFLFLSLIFTMTLYSQEDTMYFQENTMYPQEGTIDGRHSIDEANFFLWDKDLSMSVGAEDILTIFSCYKEIDDIILEPVITNIPTFIGRWVRGGKMLFVDFPVGEISMVVQHEFFGHGFRLREHGIIPSYEFSKPFPYGDGGGSTGFFWTEDIISHPAKMLAIYAGGTEANGHMAQKLASKTIARGMLDYREGLLYLMTMHDQTMYIRGIDEIEEGSFGHDIVKYNLWLNAYHGKEVKTYEDLRKDSLINFIDPMMFFSFYSINKYIATGERDMIIPMIPIWKGYSFLPGGRLTLAPYGTEQGIYAYVKAPDSTITKGYVRYGNTGGRTSYAAGLEKATVWYDYRYNVGAKVDVWRQPNIDASTIADVSNDYGIAASVKLSYKGAGRASLFGELGAKTKGYVTGEPLDAAVILRLGVHN